MVINGVYIFLFLFPGVVLQPGVLPGDCWAMDGVSGYILIKVVTLIYTASS